MPQSWPDSAQACRPPHLGTRLGGVQEPSPPNPSDIKGLSFIETGGGQESSLCPELALSSSCRSQVAMPQNAASPLGAGPAAMSTYG